jgi:hypothetical protein
MAERGQPNTPPPERSREGRRTIEVERLPGDVTALRELGWWRDRTLVDDLLAPWNGNLAIGRRRPRLLAETRSRWNLADGAPAVGARGGSASRRTSRSKRRRHSQRYTDCQRRWSQPASMRTLHRWFVGDAWKHSQRVEVSAAKDPPIPGMAIVGLARYMTRPAELRVRRQGIVEGTFEFPYGPGRRSAGPGPDGWQLHVVPVLRLRGLPEGHFAQDVADQPGETQGDGQQPGGVGGVPVHLGQHHELAQQVGSGGVADVVGDLERGGDVAVGIAAEVGEVAAGVKVGDVASLEHGAPQWRILAGSDEADVAGVPQGD